MKTRTITAMVVMTLTMVSLASMASAQTIIRDSGNGTGNSINAGGGFGPTEIRNSGNGDFNTIDARPTWGHTVAPQSYHQTITPQSYHRTYTVRRQVYPTYTTLPHSYPSVTRYHAPPRVRYVPATRPARYVDPVRVEPVTYTVPLGPQPVRTWTGGTVIRDSGNGTGNTINAQGGFGASVIGSGNGENNMINIGY